MKPMLLAPAGIVTRWGTVKTALLLTISAVAPAGAGAEMFMVQDADPGVNTVAGEQVSEVSVGSTGAACSVTVAVLVSPPATAETTTDSLTDTARAVAVKLAPPASAGTVTEEGTKRFALLLASAIAMLVVAAFVSDTVQVELAAPVKEEGLQASEDNVAGVSGATSETENVRETPP